MPTYFDEIYSDGYREGYDNGYSEGYLVAKEEFEKKFSLNTNWENDLREADWTD